MQYYVSALRVNSPGVVRISPTLSIVPGFPQELKYATLMTDNPRNESFGSKNVVNPNSRKAPQSMQSMYYSLWLVPLPESLFRGYYSTLPGCHQPCTTLELRQPAEQGH